MKKFIKSAFELFKKSEPVVFTEFDDDFLSFIKDKNLKALSAMLKEGYVPNQQIQGRLMATALASLDVYDSEYREYSNTINETYPNSYIDYSQIILKPLAFQFLYIMVENRVLNKDILQNFITNSKKKINSNNFLFGEKKIHSKEMESKHEIFNFSFINFILQKQNKYLWQDLISPDDDKKTLNEINSVPYNNYEHSILFNEESEVAGIILYKLKNPKSSMKEAIEFCENKLKQEYKIIKNESKKSMSLDKYRECILENIQKSLLNLDGIEKKLLFVNYYMNIIGDKQISAQQVFKDIENNNIVSNGKASSILKMLAVIYQKEIVIDNIGNNEKTLLSVEQKSFISHFEFVVKDSFAYFNNLNKENKLFNVRPENNFSLNQQDLKKKNDPPILANTLEKLRNRNATKSLVDFKINDLIENKLLKEFKNDLLLFKNSYESINKEEISDEQKSFVSEVYYEVMNSLSLYIEMKDLKIESDTYPQIISNIQKMVKKIDEIAKEQSIEQINYLNKDKKQAFKKSF